MQGKKLRVAILFGGRSAEHDVSRASAANVLRSLDPERYETMLVGITRDGRWLPADAGNGAGTGASELVVPEAGPQLSFLPGGHGRVVLAQGDQAMRELPAIDAVFPVLHGPHGEDGTVQGALELADVPYVGSGVVGSAVSMDKDVAKRLIRDAGLPTSRFVSFTAAAPLSYDEAVRAVGTAEVFVKPANMGSSVGVSKASNAQEFKAACELAFRYDRKILIEESVPNAREIECSVLEDGKGDTHASELGEIVPDSRHGFYSYTAKYTDAAGAALVIPARLSKEQSDTFKALAIKTFNTLCCDGMARIDFFLSGDRILVNEANTLPGFTNISMYPKLWEASGLPQGKLMDVLIEHALARHQRAQAVSVHR
ncbi:MAG: D-alanine--D-alanine ligase [Proteobacteria bacterium]|nr:D-alanine--D-alanine ligase [Pseudomonadota bacterium]